MFYNTNSASAVKQSNSVLDKCRTLNSGPDSKSANAEFQRGSADLRMLCVVSPVHLSRPSGERCQQNQSLPRTMIVRAFCLDALSVQEARFRINLAKLWWA